MTKSMAAIYRLQRTDGQFIANTRIANTAACPSGYTDDPAKAQLFDDYDIACKCAEFANSTYRKREMDITVKVVNC